MRLVEPDGIETFMRLRLRNCLEFDPPGVDFFRYGGAREDRTPDLYNAIVALSQLSYGPFVPVGANSANDGGAEC